MIKKPKIVKSSDLLADSDRLDDIKTDMFDSDYDVQPDYGYGVRHDFL
jgi:hypothetical protein